MVSLRHNFLTHIDFRGGCPRRLISLDLHDNFLHELMFDPPDCFGGLKITRNKILMTDEEFLDDSPF